MRRGRAARAVLIALGLALFGCGAVTSSPDGGGGAGGSAAGAGGSGGQGGAAAGGGGNDTAGQGGGGGAAGAAGTGGVAGSAGTGGTAGTSGGGGTAGGAGGTSGGGGTGGGGTGGAGGTSGAGGTAGSAGSGGSGGGAAGTTGAAGSGGSAAGSGGGAGTGGTPALPIITSTNFAVVAHGLDLTIGGSGFTGATALTIGGVAHTPDVVSSTQVKTRVLDTTQIGGRAIVITTAAGASAPFSITVVHLVINELDADQDSVDTGEFVEISAGVPNVSLAGYSLVLWNGASEQAYAAYDLSGLTNSDGLLMIGNPGVTAGLTFPDNTLQNGADAVGVYAAAASSFPTGSLVTSSRLIDAVVYGTGDDDDDDELLDALFGAAGTAGRVQADEGANGMPTTQSIQRCWPTRLRGDRFVAFPPSPAAVNAVTPCNN